MAVYATLTFTPRAPGRLIVTVDYEAVGSGLSSDWVSGGNQITVKPYIKQGGGSYNYGPTQFLASSRLKFMAAHSANVVAGSSVDCGLELSGSGIVSGTVFNANIKAFLAKETSS